MKLSLTSFPASHGNPPQQGIGRKKFRGQELWEVAQLCDSSCHGFNLAKAGRHQILLSILGPSSLALLGAQFFSQHEACRFPNILRKHVSLLVVPDLTDRTPIG